ncbi:YeeE/YedE family protein [uncultured Sunxiuqinia sp.]|uniref:YeeE/YedE family protein n=1 Tax=uncultured Sunxiuqinia sp. TaxID=1573825 RepID=UPI002604F92F|nr:YeeE/YedE family protein [uncultured Sunxiuqinia sp.]
MTLLILVFGFLFGAALQHASLNKYNVISGMATLEDLTVAKAIALAIGVGVILINFEIGLGLATYHVKPFMVGGILIGGLIFGIGMAVLGYCPGTLAISLGEGSLDALTGIIGGMLGGWVYTLVLPSIEPLQGANLGKISLHSLTGENPTVFYLLVVVIGLVFIAAAFGVHKLEKSTSKKWIGAGIALALLNVIIFSTATFNRPIGASTVYPYLGDLLTGTTSNAYFEKIEASGSWQLLFLGGAFLSGLVLSLLRKDFKLTLIHENWQKYKGNSSAKRLVWAFAGGFIMIFGARMAGGCTSGHAISGGMQIAIGSLVFAVMAFAGLLGTGKLFYKGLK